ncbi:MAG: hypothetical protein IKK98_07870, partial [Oscillospiraceae bacterium]|nr:hypothetical protein [Oscillospiraceae bacterium]
VRERVGSSPICRTKKEAPSLDGASFLSRKNKTDEMGLKETASHDRITVNQFGKGRGNGHPSDRSGF